VSDRRKKEESQRNVKLCFSDRNKKSGPGKENIRLVAPDCCEAKKRGNYGRGKKLAGEGVKTGAIEGDCETRPPSEKVNEKIAIVRRESKR